MEKLRIGIVGGSLAGLFAGIMLQQAGHDVRIYERSKSGLAGRGAGLVGQRDLLHILRLIGCEHVARIGVVAKERIYLDQDGVIAQTVKAPQTQISWDYLFETVASRIASGSYVLGRDVVKVLDGESGAELIFGDGTRVNVDLVIGADGLGSVVRAAVNLGDTQNRYSGYVAWRGLIPETRLPTAANLLLDRFAFHVRPGVHALGYLVPGSKGEMDIGNRRYNWGLVSQSASKRTCPHVHRSRWANACIFAAAWWLVERPSGGVARRCAADASAAIRPGGRGGAKPLYPGHFRLRVAPHDGPFGRPHRRRRLCRASAHRDGRVEGSGRCHGVERQPGVRG